MNFRLKSFILFLLIIAVIIQACSDQDINKLKWPEVKTVHKPGTYWWWMGSAVDAENLTYNLESLKESGIGNVHVIPIYGVEGEEDNYIDFLSDDWMEVLAHTTSEASRLKLNVDMSTTTGWPFGGSHVTNYDAAKKIEFEKFNVSSGERINKQFERGKIQAVVAYSTKNDPIDLSTNIDSLGRLNWKAPNGLWEVYVIYSVGTEQKVKRAAPGNVGLVLDPFSKSALNNYLKRYEDAFSEFNVGGIRAQYHDSYEYYNANWTSNYFEEFKKHNGYDLRKYLPQILNPKNMDMRIVADYRRTLSDLHLKYIRQWTDWSHSYGWITRNEAHGAPGNLLDLYAASDIPEAETFGARELEIPGVRFQQENISESVPPNPLVLKFASSPANVTGKNLVASETCTWLREHFKTSLAQIKPQIDELFLNGINHIFYHGNAYSPKDAEWPGWIFYASTHFEQENSIWKDIPSLNSYVTRCQSFLQESRPDNDVLLYWPIEDIYHSFPERILKQLSVHDIDWLFNSNFGKLAKTLHEEGYMFDYISDNQIKNFADRKASLNNSYKVIVIPKTEYMSVETLQNLIRMTELGMTVLFENELPESVPGYSEFKRREKELEERKSEIEKLVATESRKVKITNNVNYSLNELQIRSEEFNSHNLSFIRKRTEDGFIYFVSNFSNRNVDAWIPLSVSAVSAALFDPRYEDKFGLAQTRIDKTKLEIFIQIDPGESFFIKTFSSPTNESTKWNYIETHGNQFSLTGDWKIDFIEGGPEIPQLELTKELKSWTEFEDSNTENFSGTGRYTLEFELSEENADDWLLELGTVSESAKIKINDEYVGCLWSVPNKIIAGDHLKVGNNKLEIEVTNLSANRIRYLDRNNINWRKFFFVNVRYKKFDASEWPIMESGLLGPVYLTPVKYKEF